MLNTTDPSRPARVLIVDDTRTIRAMIRAILERSPMIQVVGEAGDPYEAREKIRALNPDVITLDVVMPRMDGLSFLERLMRLRPMPVVMVSTRTTERSKEAVAALSLGAVECVDLGQLRQSQNADALAQTVLMAAGGNVSSFAHGRAHQSPDTRVATHDWNRKIVLIGSSTGGVDALLQVLSGIPDDGPPIVLAQHMPKTFLESFAARLERKCRPSVALSRDGAKLEQGQVYLSVGGDTHTGLCLRDPFRLQHVPHDGAELYVPSVDVLFRSAVSHAKKVVAVLLTGMGNDGAEAMLKLREAGAHTIVQDAASAVIDGMPRSAREIGAAAEVASLSKIGQRIMSSTSRSLELNS